jgi:hypothetical protein
MLTKPLSALFPTILVPISFFYHREHRGHRGGFAARKKNNRMILLFSYFCPPRQSRLCVLCALCGKKLFFFLCNTVEVEFVVKKTYG